jgi:hypothetical protein
MVLTSKKEHKRIVSLAATRGEKGSKYISFPYAVFETSLLRYMTELKPIDLSDHQAKPDALEDTLDTLQGRMEVIEQRLSRAEKELEEGGDFARLVALMRKWEDEKQAITTEMDGIKEQIQASDISSLGSVQQISDLLANAEGSDLIVLRTRLRQQIRQLVKEIWVEPRKDSCGVSVRFRAGGVRVVDFAKQSQKAMNIRF